jgi:hypothetical protein
MRRKNIIVPVLILLSLAVWGNNAYRIFIGLTKSDGGPSGDIRSNAADTSGVPVAMAKPESLFVYRNDVRDPFEPAFLRRSPDAAPVRKPSRKAEPQRKPPGLRYCGVVTDGEGPLAIIDGPDGESVLVRENGMVAGVSVLFIRKDRIECAFGKKKFVLELRP